MSRKDICWSNMPMESFVGTLKTVNLNQYHLPTREEAGRPLIAQNISTAPRFYRPHNSSTYLSTKFDLAHLNQGATSKSTVS
jgi:hypothetical protein